MMATASRGKAPLAVSPESITASVPSSTAFATSEHSARVGRGFEIIDSSICGEAEGKAARGGRGEGEGAGARARGERHGARECGGGRG